jgi:DNA polymerase-3 subunit gamma/tau
MPERPAAAALAGVAFNGDWPGLARALTASMPRAGLVGQFMAQSELLSAQGLSFQVRVPVKPLAEPGLVGKVKDALTRYLGAPVQIRVEVGAVQGTTAAAVIHQEQAQAQAQARADIEQDDFVQSLIQGFDATILPGSIQPLASDSSGETPS